MVSGQFTPVRVVDHAAVQEMADADPRLCGMVAHLPVEKGAAIERDLVALKTYKSLRCIRRLIEIEPNPTFCLEPAFIAGVKLVGKHGLTFDICVKHWALVFGLEPSGDCLADSTRCAGHEGSLHARHVPGPP